MCDIHWAQGSPIFSRIARESAIIFSRRSLVADDIFCSSFLFDDSIAARHFGMFRKTFTCLSPAANRCSPAASNRMQVIGPRKRMIQAFFFTVFKGTFYKINFVPIITCKNVINRCIELSRDHGIKRQRRTMSDNQDLGICC